MLRYLTVASFAISAVLFSACSTEQTPDSGSKEQFYYPPEHAVVPGIAPHHVILVSKHNLVRPLCSGALLNKNWVLTTANCVQNKDKMRVIAGITNLFPWKQSGERLSIKTVHQDTQSQLALLELQKPSQKGQGISFLNKDAFDKSIVSTRLNGYATLNQQYPSLYLLAANEAKPKHCVGDLGSPIYGKYFNDPYVLLKGILLEESNDCGQWKYVDVTEHSDWIQNVSKISGVNPDPHPPALPIQVIKEGKLKPEEIVYFPNDKGIKFFAKTPMGLEFIAPSSVHLDVQRKDALGRWKTVQSVQGNGQAQQVNHQGPDSYWRWKVVAGTKAATYKLTTYRSP